MTNSMLTFGVRRAQLDLQCHRLWLRTFSSSHSSSLKITREPQSLGERRRPLRKSPREIVSFKELLDTSPQDEAPRITRSPAQQRKWERKTNRTIGQKLRDAPKSRIVNLNALGAREELFDAVKEQDAEGIIQAYRSLSERKPLSSEDFHVVAQCIHTCLRLAYQTPEAKRDRDAISDIVAFAELLARDIKRGDLIPNVAAHMHLLGIFKESRALDAGERFWNWLQTQDDSHVGTEVYGVAIEIFALSGHPLQDCEKLYDEALSRFPGTFLAYHLSPNAILTDREKPTELRGVPMVLVNAIIQARLLLGDTQKAYLALDTALRLYPTVISRRILKTFQVERPITEAYAVYAMTYRAGMDTAAMTFKSLFSSLRLASNMSSVPVHFQVLRAMVSILYLYVGNAKVIASNTVSELTIAITHIGLLPGVAGLAQPQRDELFNLVLDIIKTTWEVSARYKAFPTLAAFNSIIANVALPARSRAIVDIALGNMKTMGIEPTETTRRAVMNVAGVIGDEDLVHKTWDGIVEARGAKGKRPDLIDLNVTIKAARQAGMKAFVQQQADISKQYLPPNDQSSVEYYTTSVLREAKVAEAASSTATALLKGVRKLRADLAVFDEKTREPSHMMDASKRPGMLLREPSIFAAISESEMRKIYDDFTTEQVKPSPDSFAEHETSAFSPTADGPDDTTAPLPTETHTSATGLSLSTLRYESWRAINSLLYHSARNDRAHSEAVDLALREGKAPPKRNMGFTGENLEVAEFGFGRVGLREWLVDGEADGDGEKSGDGNEVELARREIWKLRGREE